MVLFGSFEGFATGLKSRTLELNLIGNPETLLEILKAVLKSWIWNLQSDRILRISLHYFCKLHNHVILSAYVKPRSQLIEGRGLPGMHREHRSWTWQCLQHDLKSRNHNRNPEIPLEILKSHWNPIEILKSRRNLEIFEEVLKSS